MKLSDFNYNLVKKNIPKYPVSPRDKAKLLVVNKETGGIESKVFSNVIDHLESGDVLVVNESRVIQARLYGRKEKTNAKIEVFLLRELNTTEWIWDVIVDPARKVRIGNKIYFEDGMWCEVIDNTTSRGRTVRFNKPNVLEIIEKIGLTPLPPYIKRDSEPGDRENYQTVYAKVDGSVAAPTAGLHFTNRLLEKIKKKGVEIAPIILHIGLGTFRDVEVEDLTKHRMDSEYFHVPRSSVEIINKAISNQKKVVVVGTSTVRALESSVTAEGFARENRGWTDKFIYPPYDFKITKKLITNFHNPQSTLIMLVCAFGGTELTMKAYKRALKEGYRMLSYGDAMMVE
ncbi:MAG: tRNA preQ1(34) S-adenosylmethionine ribosyltransferase-isomerase QueA [Ignavibacteriales bacterium]|jgi:S-adenosylmethionine:tRNA ribosyltransferase-isomerase|nr:tRNA preQ1(34) S-adenosylmethionine ribosyltransferase-isomerase QueA [Ignavibacteriaceae bacterium]NLH61229.1 tRNA preQ1(34) S-adenosylmethionine ribosyltransferase-isomerase QueA [Ignavibacteriales bacterium]HOJ19115.1 tRNA preQ1(34) S-adenosylmethionine ribosyltransferase-isomerase QueA [Ignavibacteriaceae bacterium]HPO54634.1 tRNA preQ1(34) S-adenosylmethionine ribosyltransferase-isomerase QueA [Ignavibacteriaceae bacterium]